MRIRSTLLLSLILFSFIAFPGYSAWADNGQESQKISVKEGENPSASKHPMVPAGKVLTARGTVKAIASDSSERKLKRRSEFYETDLLVTDAKSRAQIRFTDDTVMALKPNTEFEVANYTFDPSKPQEGKHVGRLIKGGFRALSGKIAGANPKNYRIETPVATIGIRGTNYSAVLTGKNLSVAVWQGAIRLSNEGGTMDLGDGFRMRYGQVLSRNEQPQGLVEPPPELEHDCSSYFKNAR